MGQRELTPDPNLLSNLEKAAERYEVWSERRAPGHIAAIRQFMQQERSEAGATAAKA